ncbi:MAG TPA: hypothetical protein VMQ40_04320 [Acidimicrobiales bacterium]|nr:hypothetical protein [Acidimicrobiales bacterium]
MDQEDPFQVIAKPPVEPQQPVFKPTARQNPADVQEMASSPEPPSTGGFGGGVVTVKEVPFHDSARGAASEEPAAMQKVLERHETAQRPEDDDTVAVETCVHAVPFHTSAAPLVGSTVVAPTAMHHVDDTHETDLSQGVPDGSGI